MRYALLLTVAQGISIPTATQNREPDGLENSFRADPQITPIPRVKPLKNSGKFFEIFLEKRALAMYDQSSCFAPFTGASLTGHRETGIRAAK
jgi:hypothetical protein